MFVSLITGTRPQIIKSVPVLTALEQNDIDCEFIHTGQHYDYTLADSFISDFELKPPVNLNIGAGPPPTQIARIIERLSKHLLKIKPSYIIVPGDTNSALGAAITGFMLDIPVCHLESGLRIFDFTLKEEINRRLIDHGSSGLFTPTNTATDNLSREQVQGSVFQIGDTMYDILKKRLPLLSEESFRNEVRTNLEIDFDTFAVVTLHRRETVDSPKILTQVISALNRLDFPIIFPIHPRTKTRLRELSLEIDTSHIKIVDPLPYDDFIALVADSKLVISDSGGLQKESYLLNVPTVTLRNRTEWVETLQAEANVLSDLTIDDILFKCNQMFAKKLENSPDVFGDGNAAKRIPPILESGEIVTPRDIYNKMYSTILKIDDF